MVGLVGLVVVLSQVNRGRDFDSKLYKAAVQVSAKVPIIVLYGRAVLVLAEFLQENVPVAISKAKVDSKLRDKLRSLVAAHDESLVTQVHSLNLRSQHGSSDGAHGVLTFFLFSTTRIRYLGVNKSLAIKLRGFILLKINLKHKLLATQHLQ
jgi:hypothetical protein